jgi:hypothetical protein
VSEAAAGYGEARGALDELGLSAKDLERLAPEDRIAEVLDALRAVGDEGTRARLAAKIFDSEGVELVRLTGDAYRAARDEIERLDIAITELDTASVEAMNDQFTILGNNVRSLGTDFTSGVAPGVETVVGLTNELVEEMLGIQAAGEAASTGLVIGFGSVGAVFEQVGDFAAYVELKLQRLNVLASEVGSYFGDDQSTALLGEQRQILAELESSFEERRSDPNFLQRSLDRLDEVKERAIATQAEIQRLREERASRASVPDVFDGPETTDRSTGVTTPPAANDSQFEAIVSSLATQTESIQIEYQRRIDIIDQFKRDYPARIQEATDAELRAIEARVDALAELDKRQEDDAATERQATLQPLVANFDDTRKLLQDETDVIVEEITKRQILLQELGSLDVERKAEADALIVQLEQEKQSQLAALEQSGAAARLRQSTQTASALLGAASQFGQAMTGEGEKQAKISARFSQAQALIAGIESAEYARRHGSYYGGAFGGAAEAATSWALTLANVAGIEAALQGGSPSGASSGGGSAPTTAATRQALESGSADVVPTQNIFILTADEIIDDDKFKQRALDVVSNASSSNELLVDNRRLVRNSERAA